jgi:response regulator RpfG family c-di-GMP phosphodiesterase
LPGAKSLRLYTPHTRDNGPRTAQGYDRRWNPIDCQRHGVFRIFVSVEEVDTLVSGLLERGSVASGDGMRIDTLAVEWAQFNLDLSFEEREVLVRSTLLRDIGHCMIPEQILNAPGPLTVEEYRTIQQHAELGERLLERSERHRRTAPIARHHHERWSGGGYPDGLAGEQIELLARAVSIIDAYAAMVNGRPYRDAISEDDALLELELCAGTQFDPNLVERFAAYRRYRLTPA